MQVGCEREVGVAWGSGESQTQRLGDQLPDRVVEASAGRSPHHLADDQSEGADAVGDLADRISSPAGAAVPEQCLHCGLDAPALTTTVSQTTSSATCLPPDDPLLAKSLIWVAPDRSSKGDPVTNLIGYESSRLDNVVFCPAHALDLIVARSIHSQIRTTIRDVIYRHEINLLRARAIDSEVIDVTSVGAVLATKLSGAEGIRTPDPLHAMEVRYQLRYSPLIHTHSKNGPGRQLLATPTIPAAATTGCALKCNAHR